MELVAQGTQGFAEFLDSKEGENKWSLQGSWSERVRDRRLESLFKGDKEWSGYQLVLNSKWTEDKMIDFENGGVKGALSLIKNAWISKKGDGEREEMWLTRLNVEKEKDTKVWLIMAQGQKNIYLMPVVKTKDGCSYFGGGLRGGMKKKIEEKGIENIKEWVKGDDSEGDWTKEQNEKLKGLMSSGFSITRKADTAIYSAGEEGHRWAVMAEKDSWKTDMDEVNGVRYLGKNAGILKSGTGIRASYNYCLTGEAYFPLDLVILGKSEETKSKIQTSIDHSKKEQTITIEDQITEVIGVN